MIKYNGQDLADIKYNGASIKRVMKDGVQIWPDDSDKPNIPTGLVLSEYEVESELQIPTGITLREVMNIPTGITLREVATIPYIEWDYDKMYIGEGGNVNLVTLYFTGQDADITSIPAITDWVLDPFNVVNTVTVYTDRVELLMNTPFTSASSVTISYSPGVNPLKDIDGILLTELNDQPLENLLVPSFTYLLDDYPTAAAAYSLRKLRTGEVNAVEVRRSNDDATTNVLLYDDPSQPIDLLSEVEAGGTLGDWAGGNSVFVATWYDQSGNGNHAIQAVGTRQPTLISSGVLIESNGKAALQSAITKGLYTASQILYDNTWSIHGVVEPSDLAPSSSSVILAQHTGSSDVGRTYYSYVTAGNLKTKLFFNNGTSYVGSASMDWALKQTSFSNYASSNNYSWSQDGSTPETVISGQTVTPVANPLGIGNLGNADSFGSYFSGVYQEFVIYDTNQSANREAIEDNINDTYGIYVVTAEVDAQLIQADNDNVSDTIIEINGVRSSASDTAVANLISRNNTVITN